MPNTSAVTQYKDIIGFGSTGTFTTANASRNVNKQAAGGHSREATHFSVC
jgi:hypothetical protein